MSEGKPVPAQLEPYKVAVEKGRRYFWCACGLSAKQPFCDGAHKQVGLAPLAYVAEETGDLWFCGCKATNGKPLCDGTHKSLQAGGATS